MLCKKTVTAATAALVQRDLLAGFQAICACPSRLEREPSGPNAQPASSYLVQCLANHRQFWAIHNLYLRVGCFSKTFPAAETSEFIVYAHATGLI